MTSLPTWLTKPRISVRIDTSIPSSSWMKRSAWIKALRLPFAGRQAERRARIEVLDRLSLGGKKSLLLVSIEGRRMLVGVGEEAAPSISAFGQAPRVASSRISSRVARTPRARRAVR